MDEGHPRPTRVATFSDRELIVNYLSDMIGREVGVNYFLAKEMEKRGFRDPSTSLLTPKVLETLNSPS